MAESTHNPNSIACIQWETLLPDALDGLLRPEDHALFSAHKSVCPACAALFEEARRGREWLEFLSPEPEVPAGLLARILAQTGPDQIEGYGLMPAANNVLPMPPPWQRSGFMANIRRFAEPRLLMTAAMAFFSVALTLNLTGVHLSAVRLADLRPIDVRTIPGEARSFLERRLTMASTPVVRYYDHSRFVYEVQSKVRELRRATQSEDSDQQKPSQVSPGESKRAPSRIHGGSPENSSQQSGNQPAIDNQILQTSLRFHGTAPAFRRLQKNTTEAELEKRSTRWTA
ncbi:MAG: zf-HC2 domain-containing protein [Terracidiphilus sp.]|jgi:hypothetical protein